MGHGEQRAFGVFQAKQFAYVGGVDRFAFPVANAERAEQVSVGGRIPAFIDAVGNAAEQALLGFGGEETVETWPKAGVVISWA